MNKILTISIAAYNMEQYIKRTLDSLLDERIIDQLEIIVVDDGSTDKTLEIARQYAERYPQSIIPIHKENGGYGSTINTSIKLATGKYFKQLDGDDWFVTESLVPFVKMLSEIDADYVITQALKYYQIENKDILVDWCAYLEEGLYAFDDIKFQGNVPMFGTCFRTAILQDKPIHVTENCFYTDNELVCLPVPYIKTVYIWHHPVYVYFIGREGQSISIGGIQKHYKEHEAVVWKILKIYEAIGENHDSKKQFVRNKLISLILEQFAFYCYIDHFMDKRREMAAFYKKLQNNCPEVLQAVIKERKYLKLYSRFKGLLYPFLTEYVRYNDFRKR